MKTLEELEKDGPDETTNSDQLRPESVGRSLPTPAGPTEQAETSERKAWHTSPLDPSIPQTDISIVPGNVEKPERARDRRDKRSETEQSLAGPGEATPAYSAFETPWQDRLLDCLLKMKPAAFERLCQRILKDSGFIKVDVTGRSGDGGIDGIGVLRLNLLSFHVFFQCKRWKGSVGASTIRDFRGAMVGRADKGLVMTTGTFTVDARKEATRDGAPAIDLVDGETLCELLKSLKIGVSIRKVEHVLVEQDAFLDF